MPDQHMHQVDCESRYLKHDLKQDSAFADIDKVHHDLQVTNQDS